MSGKVFLRIEVIRQNIAGHCQQTFEITQQGENTVKRKCDYEVFQITNSKNLVKSQVEDK
jgi:hypothetical protein